MKYVANGHEAKEIDRVSIEKYGMPSLVLMERASLKLAQRIAEFTEKDRPVLVVAGVGNNGGDGIAAARMLAEMDFDVRIWFPWDRQKASGECQTQLGIAQRLQIPVITEDSLDMAGFSVIVDAVFGIGLSREITGRYREIIEAINEADACRVAVDIPSGIDADTGAVYGVAVKADWTITFGVNKLGLLLFPGAAYAGKVLVEEIGFPRAAVEEAAPQVISYEREDVARLFPKRIPDSNKGSYGRVLVIAGSAEMFGAALFAAKAAYQMGSGLVKLITHENNRAMIQAELPEALLYSYRDEDGVGDGAKEGQEQALQQIREDIRQAAAIILGPGIGKKSFAATILETVLEEREKPIVLDADAINLLAEKLEGEEALEKLLSRKNLVLTPHLKEMSRLCKCEVRKLKEDLPGCARRWAGGSCLVLKDARTVVSDGKRSFINTSGNNALAKGGSGDVLSGMIGGLLALKMPLFEAASLGVYLHGLTAEEYVKTGSSSSMLARDILGQLPKVLP